MAHEPAETIMIRDCYGGSDPIRTPVETKSPKHAPAEKLIFRICWKTTKAVSRISNIPSPRLVFSIEVCQNTFKVLDISLERKYNDIIKQNERCRGH